MNWVRAHPIKTQTNRRVPRGNMEAEKKARSFERAIMQIFSFETV
jgi:hypothetical protein